MIEYLRYQSDGTTTLASVRRHHETSRHLVRREHGAI